MGLNMNMNYGMSQGLSMNPMMMMGMGVQTGYAGATGYQNSSALMQQMMMGLLGGNGYNAGMMGYGGGFQGLGQMTGQYGGGYMSYEKVPVYKESLHQEAIYKQITEQQAFTTNDPGRMWDVNFDYKAGQDTKTRSPIVLDLNGNGKPDITGSNILGNGKVEGQTVMFDIDPTQDSWQNKSLHNGKYYEKNSKTWGSGEWKDGVYYFGKKEPKEKTEWLQKNGGDGFLVWDVDNDGKITSSKELFGNYDIDGKEKFDDGYQKLAQYFDKDKSGLVSGDELKGLNIWKDDNADGITQEGELKSLAEFGITSLDVSNIDKKDMSTNFNREKTTYQDVTKTVLDGYREYTTQELVGHEERLRMEMSRFVPLGQDQMGMSGMMGMMGMGGYSGMNGMQGMMGMGGYSGMNGMQGMMGMGGYSGMNGMMGMMGMGGYSGMNGMMGMMGMGGYSDMSGMMGMGGYSGMNGMQGMTGYSDIQNMMIMMMMMGYGNNYQASNYQMPSTVGFEGFGGINGNGLAAMKYLMAQNGYSGGGNWF